MKRIIVSLLLVVLSFTAFSCPRPDICYRNCWDPSGSHPGQSNPAYTDPTHIIVHHTGDPIVFPANTDYAEKVRFYWDLHVNTNGWSDIGYNYLIGRNGVIYEARGSGVRGAHFSCMNRKTLGIAMIGNFEKEEPSEEAIIALQKLIAWEAKNNGIDITRVKMHTSSELHLHTISGHQDGNSSQSSHSCAKGTVCPGKNLYAQLPKIRIAINDLECFEGRGFALDCSDAVALEVNTMYHGEESSASSKVGAYGCSNWTETGPERVHTFTPKSSGKMTAKVSNFEGDLDVFILGSCSPSDCMGSVGSVSSTLETAEEGKTYYIVVDADDGSGSSYDLVVEMSTPTALDQGLVQDIKVYPNPVADLLEIENSTNLEVLKVEVYDLQGKMIKTYQPTKSHLYDVKNLKSGLYLFKVWMADKREVVLRVEKL